jgi:hypothetical protein
MTANDPPRVVIEQYSSDVLHGHGTESVRWSSSDAPQDWRLVPMGQSDTRADFTEPVPVNRAQAAGSNRGGVPGPPADHLEA